MKRNETVLVYAVTGLLLVILLVAVVFGEQPAAAKERSTEPSGRKVTELPGVAPAEPPATAHAKGREGGGDPGADGPSRPASSDQAPPDPSAGITPATLPATEGGEESGDPVALHVTVTPSQQLEEALGSSRRMGDYRVVQAWNGASLRSVVERWCGDAKHLPAVEVLNEGLIDDQLAAGQEVVLPFVEPEILLEVVRTREERQQKAELAKGALYTLKRGDSLWKLAGSRVAQNQIPAWLQRFKQLNPTITDLGTLREGQRIRLPR